MSQADLLRYLTEERAHYLEGFRASYKAWCQEKSGVCAAELLMRPNSMRWPEPYAQMRLDMVSNLNGKFEASRYEHEKPWKNLTGPRRVTIGPLSITLHSVVWNRIAIRSRTSPPALDPLSEWAVKWLDPHESKSPGQDQLVGVIHGATFPGRNSGHWQFMVDFGSAPVAAFEEILIALSQMGLREISVGTFGPIQ